MFETLAEAAARDGRLAALGRDLDADVLLEAGDRSFRLTIREGHLRPVETGPFVMPSCDFRIAAREEDWARFLRAVPPPGSHDLFALLRRGALRLDGNLHPFMANLMYFKRLLASLRPEPDPETEAEA